MMTTMKSVQGVPIRLSNERLAHIVRRHPELAGEEAKIEETVHSPDSVQEGDAGSLIALRHYEKTSMNAKYCAVVYKEESATDGFVLTAYLTRRPAKSRRVLWKR